MIIEFLLIKKMTIENLFTQCTILKLLFSSKLVNMWSWFVLLSERTGQKQLCTRMDECGTMANLDFNLIRLKV